MIIDDYRLIIREFVDVDVDVPIILNEIIERLLGDIWKFINDYWYIIREFVDVNVGVPIILNEIISWLLKDN